MDEGIKIVNVPHVSFEPLTLISRHIAVPYAAVTAARHVTMHMTKETKRYPLVAR